MAGERGPTPRKVHSTRGSGGLVPGSRPACAGQANGAAPREGKESLASPFRLGGRWLRLLERSDVRAFHGCYIVARGGAPVREAARAGGGRAGAAALSASASPAPAPDPRAAPRSPARRPRVPTARLRTPRRVASARRWSCSAARVAGMRPGPGPTRGCWGTSVSCRVCSAWKSVTCPEPPTSSACRGRSSRT